MQESIERSFKEIGIPIINLPEFIDVPINEKYHTTLIKIEDHIVYEQSRSDLKYFDLEKFNAVVEHFCVAVRVVQPYVQIRNQAYITGRLSFKNIKKQIRWFYDHQDTMIGLVIVEGPSWLRPFIMQGMRYFKPTFRIAMVENDADAIIAARQILTGEMDNPFDTSENSNADGPLRFSEILFKSEWEFNNAETGFRYRIGCIPNHLLFTSIHGTTCHPDDITNACSLLEKVMEENHLTEIPFMIADYSETDKTSIHIRQVYAKEIKRITSITHNVNVTQFIINAQLLNKISIRLFSPFVKKKFIFVDSIKQAFERINQLNDGIIHDDTRKDLYVTATDLEELSDAFSMLQLEEAGKIPDVTISKNNPLAYLAESLVLIRCDLNELRENERQSLNERLLESESTRRQMLGMLEDVEDAKAALAKEEELKRILLDNIHTQVWYLTNDHTYGAVNKAHADFNGKKIEDIAFKDLCEIFPKEIVDVCKQSNAVVFNTKKTVCTEEWVPHVSGEKRLISITKTPKMRDDGSVEYVVCSAEDITEKKNAEDALKTSESNFRAFFASMQDMIVVSTFDSRVLYANDALFQKLGYKLEELNEFGVLGIHPKDRQQEAEEIFAAMFRGERNSCPLPVQRKDGALVPVETRVSFGKWDGIDCIFGISKDLTAEQEAKQRFEQLFQNNPALMALSSLPDHRFVDVNDAFLKTLGFSRAEILGKSSAELILFPDVDQQKLVTERLAVEGHIADFELKVRARDGSLHIGLFSGEVVISQNRRYILTVMIDITDRIQAEEQIKLQNQKLLELNATKDKFFSIIAHDLKSPFNSIMGFSELIADQIREKDYEGVEKFAGIILQSSKMAMDLLMNLLEWARSQTGRMEFNPEYFELVDFIKENLILFQDAVRQKSITMKFESPHNLPAFADKPMISTVIRNLLSNAIKFTRQCGEIVISAKKEHNEVLVSVSDNGVGIEKMRLNNLFRIDKNESTRGTANEKGTGLGLILCLEFIEKHGGRIWVESDEGTGSVFFFALPLK